MGSLLPEKSVGYEGIVPLRTKVGVSPENSEAG